MGAATNGQEASFFLKQAKISVYVDGGYIWLIIASRIHLKALMTVPNAAEE
ncbi:hypothetical protein AC93_3815 [Escherichia coli 2-005-03_S4_C2]|nr:hypothetical protein AD23_3949 [Escherichia coli 2-005-03_S4_C3]EZJ48559.1 hypothetical protein AC93_3815 [Escherichia coli 2-005-03_S4_C2]KDT25452.1 hypothetical protein AC67_4108 [Escherichia coli 2-052-05_S4_C1]